MYGRTPGFVLWPIETIRHHEYVCRVDLSYGPAMFSFAIFYVQTSGPASMCHQYPVTYLDILLFVAHGIHSAPSGSYAQGGAIVIGQYQAGLGYACVKLHVGHQHIVVQSLDLVSWYLMWRVGGLHDRSV